MKKLFFCLAVILTCHSVQAQDTTKVKSKYDFYFDIGTTIYIGGFGPTFGLAFMNPNRSLSFAIRSNYYFHIGKGQHWVGDDSTGYQAEDENYSLLALNTMLYFDLEYSMMKKLHVPLDISLGYGWITLGKKENYRFNRDYGYAVASLKLRYEYSWLAFELRGNIPIKEKYFKKYTNSDDWLFPVDFGLIYRFKPKMFKRNIKS